MTTIEDKITICQNLIERGQGSWDRWSSTDMLAVLTDLQDLLTRQPEPPAPDTQALKAQCVFLEQENQRLYALLVASAEHKVTNNGRIMVQHPNTCHALSCDISMRVFDSQHPIPRGVYSVAVIGNDLVYQSL